MVATTHRYELQVLERHLDTFGHVNHATYLEIYEEARWDWITAGGYGLAVVQSERRGPTILECTVRYQRELKLRERIVVESEVAEYRSKVATVRQRLLTAAGKMASEASFVIGLFDTEARRLVAPTAKWLAAFGFTESDWAAGRIVAADAGVRAESKEA